MFVSRISCLPLVVHKNFGNKFYHHAKMASREKKVITDAKPRQTRPVSAEASKMLIPTTNGLSSLNEVSDSNSDGSGGSERKLIRRSSMICSEGFDKYTYDCSRDDIPHRSVGLELDGETALLGASDVSSLSDRTSILSDGEISPGSSLIKRDSIVHPGSSVMKRDSIVHPVSLYMKKDSGGSVMKPGSSVMKRDSIVHPVSLYVKKDSGGSVMKPGSSVMKRDSVVQSGSSLMKRDSVVQSGSSLMKRDSVVHPGRADIQRSLYVNGKFQNPWPTWRPPTITNILKFGLSKDKSNVPSKQELDLVLPIVRPNFTKNAKPPEDGIRVTWIGHSTVLVQMHGLNVLTDPIFSDRASPSQVVGPKRYRDPPCTIHDLPHINAVVISHSHYDHLDFNTVTLLNARFGTDIRWFVPLGLMPWMHQIGCENVVELDWWEENCVPEHSDTFFVFTPAQHWSKRTITDDNKVLWGSWCIIGPQYRFFFAGDTGYCDAFKQIGRVHGPFDLAAIPIGAFEPRWFMRYQHVDPEEAVKLHVDVRSKYSLAIHWGTFCLANEYYLDPPVKLRENLEKRNIPVEFFFTLKHGETRLISRNSPMKRDPAKPLFFRK